jgi:hypothetical protein
MLTPYYTQTDIGFLINYLPSFKSFSKANARHAGRIRLVASLSACDQVCLCLHTISPPCLTNPLTLAFEQLRLTTDSPQRLSENVLDNLHDMAESVPIIQKPGRQTPKAEDDVTTPKAVTLMGLPGELFQKIVAEMVIAVKVRGTTNLRLVNSTSVPNFSL